LKNATDTRIVYVLALQLFFTPLVSHVEVDGVRRDYLLESIFC
jgi:hypothetical protein